VRPSHRRLSLRQGPLRRGQHEERMASETSTTRGSLTLLVPVPNWRPSWQLTGREGLEPVTVGTLTGGCHPIGGAGVLGLEWGAREWGGVFETPPTRGSFSPGELGVGASDFATPSIGSWTPWSVGALGYGVEKGIGKHERVSKTPPTGSCAEQEG
jgi:hypothetical protein